MLTVGIDSKAATYSKDDPIQLSQEIHIEEKEVCDGYETHSSDVAEIQLVHG